MPDELLTAKKGSVITGYILWLRLGPDKAGQVKEGEDQLALLFIGNKTPGESRVLHLRVRVR